MTYALSMIKRYDENGNGVLEESEWSGMSRSPAGADSDGDNNITPEELARFYLPKD